MDIAVVIYALVALAGMAIGWLAASYRVAQQRAEQLAEERDVYSELSAAKQQIAQNAHWREECELLKSTA